MEVRAKGGGAYFFTGISLLNCQTIEDKHKTDLSVISKVCKPAAE